MMLSKTSFFGCQSKVPRGSGALCRESLIHSIQKMTTRAGMAKNVGEVCASMAPRSEQEHVSFGEGSHFRSDHHQNFILHCSIIDTNEALAISPHTIRLVTHNFLRFS